MKIAGLTAGLGAGGTVAAGSGVATASDETDDGEPNESLQEAECPLNGPGLVTRESEREFEPTVAAIKDRIKGSALSLMTTVDHASNAESAGMELPPTKLLLFGNPAAGTQLMQTSRTVGIDLPQKMLVWCDEGTVMVTYNDPAYLAERHDIGDNKDVLQNAAETLRHIATGETDDGGESSD